jgi:S-adenosylmethionine synthetase
LQRVQEEEREKARKRKAAETILEKIKKAVAERQRKALEAKTKVFLNPGGEFVLARLLTRKPDGEFALA